MPGTDPRITRARRAAAAGIEKATRIRMDASLNRSTATRGAYKAKADALDEVVQILGERPRRRR